MKLKGVVLYDQNSKLVRFDSFNISLSPFGLSLSGLCDGKSLYVEWSMGFIISSYLCQLGLRMRRLFKSKPKSKEGRERSSSPLFIS